MLGDGAGNALLEVLDTIGRTIPFPLHLRFDALQDELRLPSRRDPRLHAIGGAAPCGRHEFKLMACCNCDLIGEIEGLRRNQHFRRRLRFCGRALGRRRGRRVITRRRLGCMLPILLAMFAHST
jgi:hypothetical protein